MVYITEIDDEESFLASLMSRNETESSKSELRTNIVEEKNTTNIKTTKPRRRSKVLSECTTAPTVAVPLTNTTCSAKNTHSTNRKDNSNRIQASQSSGFVKSNPGKTSVRRPKRESSVNVSGTAERTPEASSCRQAKPNLNSGELINQKCNMKALKKNKSSNVVEKKPSRVKHSYRTAQPESVDEVRELKSCLKTVAKSGSSGTLKNNSDGRNVFVSTNPKNIIKMLQSSGSTSVLESRAIRQKKPTNRNIRDAQFLNHLLEQYQTLLSGMKLSHAYPDQNLRSSGPRNPFYHNNATCVQSMQTSPGVGARVMRESLYKSPWHDQFKINLPATKTIPPKRKFSFGYVDSKNSRNNIANPCRKGSLKTLPKVRSKASGVEVKTSRRNVEESKSDVLTKNRELVLHKPSMSTEEKGRRESERNEHKASRPLENSVVVEMDKHGYKISRIHGRGAPQVDALNDRKFSGFKPVTLVQGLIPENQKEMRRAPSESQSEDTTHSSRTGGSHSSISAENLPIFLRKVRHRLKEYSKKLKEQNKGSSHFENKCKTHVESESKSKKKNTKLRKRKK